MNLNQKVENYKNLIDTKLQEIFGSLENSVLVSAMKYSVENGGKRLRPVLMLLACELLGVDIERAIPFACALEIIHSSSLVHDDLPALDNDDLRRGKPSCHKKFNEAQAILCGDALLNFAYELCLANSKCQEDILCVKALSVYTGYSGMLGGQSLDIFSEKEKVANKEILEYIQINKTAKLIIAPLVMASELCGGKYIKELFEFGKNLGIAFQIVDDVLDVEGNQKDMGKTIGKDSQSGKLTDVKIYGLELSKQRAQRYAQKAIESIIDIKELTPLIDYSKYLTDRMK